MARDVVEDHERAERARILLRLVERIDHGEAVAQHVGQRDRVERAGAAAGEARIGVAPAVFDDARVDVAVLDHHGVVEHGHVRHAAVAVAGVEIGAEHRILLGGRHRHPHLADHVGVAREDAAQAARRAEFVDDHPHRDAGAAGFARRPVGDRLAAAEAAVGQQVVELARLLAHQMGEHLALLAARQIGAGRGRGEIELRRVARMTGHGTATSGCGGLSRRGAKNCRSGAIRQRGWRATEAGSRRSVAARASLLMTTVPTSMSCSSRRRSLKKPTSRMSGVSAETEIQ